MIFRMLVLAYLIFIAIVAVSSADDFKCPKSPSPVHAGCQVTINFENSCNDVQNEIQNRVSSSWVDPHNGGNYTIIDSSDTLMQLSRVTGDGKYTDLINFAFQSSSGCDVHACSESQVFSIGDAGTNFCNIHDLYCNEAGCNPIQNLKYTEKVGKCTSADASVCTA